MAGLPPNHRADVDGKPAVNAPLGPVYGLLRDRVTGRLLLHDQGLVERLEPDGTLLAFAGSPSWLDSDALDGAPASNLRISTLRGMAQDATGVIYLADAAAGRVYRIERDGTVTTFAGGGNPPQGGNGDGGPAKAAFVGSPRGLAFDSKGNLNIAEAYCQCIRRVTPDGIISTVYALPPKPFYYFEGLALDSQDNLFATEYAGHQVLKIAADGTVTTIAGTGVGGFGGDGGPAIEAQLNGPSGVAIDASGNLYIADTLNQRIREVTPDGIIATVAGVGTPGFSGDGGPAVSAQMFLPAQVLVDPDGSLFVSEFGNNRVRRISPDGIIGTIAGNGGSSNGNGIGDGGPALYATLSLVDAAVFDGAGNLFVAELQGNRVRKIAPDGTISTVAGNGKYGYDGDGGPAIKATISGPYGLTLDQQGSVYIATADSRVRKIDPGGTITLVAGTGTGTGLIRSQGDGGPAVKATLSAPKGVAVDAAGNVYIADTSNARLRVVDRNGVIRTVAGPGVLGTDYWNAVTIDPSGNVYVAITHSEPAHIWSYVARVASDGSLTTVAGSQQDCAGRPNVFTYDGQPASSVPLCLLLGLTFDSHGILYLPESYYGAVLRMAPDGTLSRIAGSPIFREYGDGGSPLAASLAGSSYYTPASVAFDSAGNLFIPQSGANRIREVTATPLVLKLSRDRVDVQGSVPRAQTVGVTTNFGEPFPYLVRIRTGDGGGWLSANRTSGLTGEALTVTADPTGLAAGVYHGSVTVVLVLPDGLQVDLPVTLTVE